MMDSYIMQYIFQPRYLVVINENTYMKYEKDTIDQHSFIFKQKKFIGKSKICSMTDFSGAVNNPNFNGNTTLLECEDGKNFYISGFEIFEFRTGDKIIEYISLMGNNLTPHAFAVGSSNTYFISTHYKSIENDKIEQGTLLNSSNDSLDPHDYHLEKCRPDSLKNR